ncbi:(d)CMP kinase [Planctomycetota bacterium]
MADLIITIDGPAGSGKSTIAHLVAQKLGAGFLDTGAMYRAVTLAAMNAGVDLTNEDKLLEVFTSTDFQFKLEHGQMTAAIDGHDVTEQIRQPKVTENAQFIASAPKIRKKLVQLQRDFAANQKRIVTEGRDQGTIAFVDADFKFFLTADPAERTRRRQAQLKEKGITQTIDQLQKAIEKRDHSDQNRTVGPLKPADDAIVIDTTDLNIEQVVENILSYVTKNN